MPTGDALRDVLLYHVLSGIKEQLDLKDNGVATTLNGAPVAFDLSPSAKVNGANITVTNVVASNGVIHVIDAVIVPPANDIVATAVSASGQLHPARAGAHERRPRRRLAGTGSVYGVRAHRCRVRGARRGADRRHVARRAALPRRLGRSRRGRSQRGPCATLLANESLTVALEQGVKVNGATVTMANILTSNGVIHVIDQVLVP